MKKLLTIGLVLLVFASIAGCATSRTTSPKPSSGDDVTWATQRATRR